jgi:hypothetical protein
MKKKKLKAGDWYTDNLSHPCVMVADGTGYGKVLAMLLAKGEESAAHARLLAAAPDLLKALEAISPLLPRSLTTVAHGAPSWTEAIRQVEDAIAKAKGTIK